MKISLQLAVVALCVISSAPSWSENSLSGTKTDLVLVAAPERALDATRPVAGGVPGIGLLQGMIATAIVERRALSLWLESRELIRPLSEQPEVKEAIRALRDDAARAAQILYGDDAVKVKNVASESERQRVEVALAPKPVLSVRTINELGYPWGCGRTGVYLVFGSGTIKKTLNIRRKPIEVYVARPQHQLAVVSEWCLPEGKFAKDGLDAAETRQFVAQLLPLLNRAREEVLSTLETDSLGDIGYRAGTHGSRSNPYFIAEYGRERTLIASPDHSVLKWVASDSVKEIECHNACGPIERAQAEEHVRKRAWLESLSGH